METPDTKLCGGPCAERRLRSEFHANAKKPDRLHWQCKVCQSEYDAARYDIAHPESIQRNATRRKRKADTPEGMKYCGTGDHYVSVSDFGPLTKCRGCSAEYSRMRRSDPAEAERQNARARERNALNPAIQAAADRRWRELYPEKDRAHSAKRRERLASVPRERWTRADIFERDEWTCLAEVCRCPDGRTNIDPNARPRSLWSATTDHIVSLFDGGPDIASNIQTMHFSCNSSKGSREMKERKAA